jgi:predicted N-acetyltransferase YhbS
MAPSDLPAVLAIQQVCYPPSMNESGATILERLACAPTLAWVAVMGGQPAAYLMTYPSTLGKVTPLGGGFEIPDEPDCLYFHDLAVRPCAIGNGLGAALVRHALASSRWPSAALVCVQDAREFWIRQGFAEAATREAQQLATYPGQARYMVRRMD